MIVDTTPDGIRIRRKSAAEQEPESRLAKRRKQATIAMLNIPTGPDEEVQAALALAEAERQQELNEAEASNWSSPAAPNPTAAGITPGQASTYPDPEEIEWESRAAGVRDMISEMLGGKAWLNQVIGDVATIQIRGNGGLCAIKNCIRVALKLPSLKNRRRDGLIPEPVCKLLVREFNAVRATTKGKSYNTWFMTNFARGDFERVTKAIKTLGDKAIEEPEPSPFPPPREDSPEPTVRRLIPPPAYYEETNQVLQDGNQVDGHQVRYQQEEQGGQGEFENGNQQEEYGNDHGYPQEEAQEGGSHQGFLDDGNHYQQEHEQVEGGESGFIEHQNGQVGSVEEYHQDPNATSHELGEFHPHHLANTGNNEEADAVESLISHSIAQENQN